MLRSVNLELPGNIELELKYRTCKYEYLKLVFTPDLNQPEVRANQYVTN